MLLVVYVIQGVPGIHHDAPMPEEEGTSIKDAGEGILEELCILGSCRRQCITGSLKFGCKVRPASVVGSRGVGLKQWRLGGEGGKCEADEVDPWGT
jgi:hypothetical protein